MASIAMASEPVTLGGRYQPLEQLGKGGMGAVFRTFDRLTGQFVALKRLIVPADTLRYNSYDAQSNLFLTLAQEFRTMASLRHPNVNSVLDYGFDKARQPYFTMELLVQPSTIFEAGWRSDTDRLDLLVQILQALEYLHRRGILHRDLKPENVLVVGRLVKVLDFGLSINADQAEQVENIAGTLGFIAPEVLLGVAPSASADLYSVGVMAYELFTGTALFETGNTQALIESTISATPDLSTIPNRPVTAVIGRLLSKDPEDRYRTATQAIQAFCTAGNIPLPQETIEIRDSFLQTARFVGREKELRRLKAALREAQEGHGSAWLLVGESGSGKTRLVDELRVQALIQGMLVLRGRNIDQGASPYQMWRSVLRWLCLVTPLSQAEAGVLKPLVTDIETLLGKDVPDAPLVSPLFAQERLLSTIQTVFSRQTQPILLILEDLHWIGQESLNVLTRLSASVAALPLLVAGSYRDDERRDLSGFLPNAQMLHLSRFTQSEVAELCEAMLGDEGRQPKLISLLEHETEGNAFFLVEAMRTLAEQAGELDRVAEMKLPEHISARSITQILQRRLARVPAESRPMLQAAAVIGRQFDLKLLKQLMPPGFDVDRWLRICLDVAVLEVQEDAWQFAHDKLRDQVLVDLSAEESQRLHRQVGAALEAVYLDAPEHFASASYHWAMAGDAEQEARYAAQTGKQALESGAYQQAAEALERALNLLSRHSGAAGQGKLEMQVKLGHQAAEAYQGLGDLNKARTLYERSLAASLAANYHWGEAETLNALGYVAQAQGNALEAADRFRTALQIASKNRARSLILAAIIGMATLLADRGEQQRAAELVMLVHDDPSTTHSPHLHERADRLLKVLKISLSPDVIAAAQTRAADMRLSEVVQRLIEDKPGSVKPTS